MRLACEHKPIYPHVTMWMEDWMVGIVLAKIEAEKHILVAGGRVTCNHEAILGDHDVDRAWSFGGRTEAEPVQPELPTKPSYTRRDGPTATVT